MPLASSNTVDLTKLKIAYFADDGNSKVSADIKAAIKNAATVLQDNVAQVKKDCPTEIGAGYEILQEMFGADIVNIYKRIFKQLNVTQPSPLILKFIDRIKEYSCDIDIFMQRWDKWENYCAQILKFFQHYDALIFPVTAQSALPLDKPMWEPENYTSVSYSWEISSTMLPAAVVRVGMTDTGLPIGVQIITKPYQEEIALAIAKCLEAKLGGYVKPKLTLS